MSTWQNYATEAALRVLDAAAERLGEGERAIHRLANSWKSLTVEEKRGVVEVGVAVTTAVVVAATAVREKGPKKAAKKLARKAGAKVVKKVARKAAGTTKKK